MQSTINGEYPEKNLDEPVYSHIDTAIYPWMNGLARDARIGEVTPLGPFQHGSHNRQIMGSVSLSSVMLWIVIPGLTKEGLTGRAMSDSISSIGNVPDRYAVRLMGKLSGLAIDALRILESVLNQ